MSEQTVVNSSGAKPARSATIMGQPQKPYSTHIAAMWGLCWRMVLLTPVAVLGIVALALVLGLTFLPPVCAVIALLNGPYVVAFLLLALWAHLAAVGWSCSTLRFRGI